MKSPVPTDEKQVNDRDREAASVVLPEHESRLADAHSRNAHPNVIARLQADYDQARYDELDARDDDGDTDDADTDSGDDLSAFDGWSHDDLDAAAAENDVDLSGARTKEQKAQRLHDAGVEPDDGDDD